MERETIGTATYSPDDNKLRIYPRHRLDAETYSRVKEAGFKWAPKQELFVAPMWTPSREDLAIELCGEIDDEDRTLVERAEERAERFEGYEENRTADAQRAERAVAEIADGIPLGQPILVGHHSERRARKDAERIENGMRKAVKMWDTAAYWKSRAAGALRHAKYKELPAVRARRIKGIESEVRKLDKGDREGRATLAAWALVDKPEGWKAKPDGTHLTREERAEYIAGRLLGGYVARTDDGRTWSAYDVLRLPVEERYRGCPSMTVDEVIAAATRAEERAKERRARWRAHYENRLEYERAMLAEAGGIATDQRKPEVGGAVLSLWGPRGGWAYIKKVNKVTVTISHQWNDGGRVFQHNEPFDKLRDVMTRAQVEEARAQGRIKEASNGIGFWLIDADPIARPTTERPADPAADMRAALKAGVKVVAAPQLFPTPAHIAAQMVELAEIEPGHRVLEPSAGTGALIAAIRQTEGVYLAAVEINGELASKLDADMPLRSDFLSVELADFHSPFDRVVMNPPFKDGADIQHILHAAKMLKPGGRLVALCANGPRQQAKLRPLASHWDELPLGSFKEQGTGVNVALLVIEAARAGFAQGAA
jgi:protein-L-isoaspartate O-methyltransferase